MTATTAAGRTGPRARFARLVLSEQTKFWSVRSSFWTLLISAGLTVGVGAWFLPFAIDKYRAAHPTGPVADIAIRQGWWYEGLHVGIVAVMILGVLVATSEYSTGTIRATLTAAPSRVRVLAAKVVSFSVVALVAGAAQAFAVFAVARPILSDRSIEVSLSDSEALRGVAMATLAIVGAGLFGLAAGMLIRHTAGAIGVVVALMWVVMPLATLLPEKYETVVKSLPTFSMVGMFTPSPMTFEADRAAALFLGYVSVLLIAATVSFVRRDA